MNERINRLNRILRPLKIKMIFEVFLNNIILGAFGGAVFGTALLGASKFVFLRGAELYAAVVFAAFCFLALVFTAFNIPSRARAAAAGDALGYKERFITALSILENGARSACERLVVEDALRAASPSRLREQYKIRVPRKNAVALAAALTCLFVAAFAPPVRALEVASARATSEKIEREIESIQKSANELQKTVTDARADEAGKKLGELIKALKKAKNEAEAARHIQNARAEIQKLANDTVAKDLKTLGDSLSAHNMSALGDAVSKGDVNSIENGLNALSEHLKNAGEEERRLIAEAMANAANDLSGDGELRKLLQEASETLEMDDALNELGEEIERLARENAALRDALNNLNGELSQSGKNIGGQTSGQGQQGQGQQGQGQGQGQQGQSQQGEGQGQGQQGQGQQGEGQQGEGQGQGQQGQGQQGEGQGEGQGQGQGQGQNQGQGLGGQGQTPGGNGRGKGHIDNENIYYRGAENKDSFEANITGVSGEGGEMTEQTVTGMGEKGESVPYGDVLESFKQSELRAVDDYDVPVGMKDLVRDYFSSLE
jgi:hypothetical protein